MSVERRVVIFWPPIFNSMTSSGIDGDVSICSSTSGKSSIDVVISIAVSSTVVTFSPSVSLSASSDLITAVRIKTC